MNQKTTGHQRLLAMLLTLIMVLGIMPMTAFAADGDPIENIVITEVDAPQIGEALDFNWTIPADAEYEKYFYDDSGEKYSCGWVRTATIPNNNYDVESGDWSRPHDIAFDKFETGYYYTFYMMLTEKDAAKAPITNDTKATVNGQKAVVSSAGEYDIVYYTFCPSATLEVQSKPESAVGKVGTEVAVTYRITNTGNCALYSAKHCVEDKNANPISMLDPTTDGTVTWPADGAHQSLDVNESFDVTFTYKVNPTDVSDKKLVRKLILYPYDKDLEPNEAAPVNVTVEIPLTEPIVSATIVKEETSAPKNGKFYVKGEKITYSITVTNDGDETLAECYIYDSLAPFEDLMIAGCRNINPMEQCEGDETNIRTFTFEYTVTAEDAKAGSVSNDAWLNVKVYENGILKEKKVTSNTVVSKTGVETIAVPGDDAPTDPGEQSPEPSAPISPDVPQTGDDSNMFLWIALMFVAGIGVVVTIVLGKKRKDKYDR